MMHRRFTSRIWMFNTEKNDWVPFSILYGTVQDNLKWLLLRQHKVRFDGTEVRLDKGQVVYAEPIDRSVPVFNTDGVKNVKP